MSICPGCGLRFESDDQSLNDRYNASSNCWQIYCDLSAFTLSLKDPDFIHQLAVDAYATQHVGPNVKPISPAFALIGLYLTFERGYTGKQVQQAHISLGKKRTLWPRFNQPNAKIALTVLDVFQSPESQRADMIKKWGRSVWEKWEPRQSVRKIVETYLR